MKSSTQTIVATMTSTVSPTLCHILNEDQHKEAKIRRFFSPLGQNYSSDSRLVVHKDGRARKENIANSLLVCSVWRRLAAVSLSQDVAADRSRGTEPSTPRLFRLGAYYICFWRVSDAEQMWATTTPHLKCISNTLLKLLLTSKVELAMPTVGQVFLKCLNMKSLYCLHMLQWTNINNNCDLSTYLSVH